MPRRMVLPSLFVPGVTNTLELLPLQVMKLYFILRLSFSFPLGRNIQLDLSETFRDFHYDETKGLVRSGVSFTLDEFNLRLGALGLFMPHGQCYHVHLGGHAQTGGYGQLTRGFGLFADHVTELEVINADCEKITVTKESDPDLFFALLGGSPGNFGVLTHLTIKPLRDEDHPVSRGMKLACLYDKRTLKNLLDVMVDMASDSDFPQDFDYCVTLQSCDQQIFILNPNLDQLMRMKHPKLYKDRRLFIRPTILIIFVQWANTKGAGQIYDPSFFTKVREAIQKPVMTLFEGEKPMSGMTREWVFAIVREFAMPYIKRCKLTNSKTLVEGKWTEWMAARVEEVEKRNHNKVKLSLQFQNFGGNNSGFYKNANNGTSHSFRDSTIGVVHDCFYKHSEGKSFAESWQERMDEEGVGPAGIFSKEDRRLFWGSFENSKGGWNLNESWSLYYDSRDKFERLSEIKQRVDPQNVFTPNDFSLGQQPAASNAITAVMTEYDDHAMVQRKIQLLKTLMEKELPEARGPSSQGPVNTEPAEQINEEHDVRRPTAY